MRRRHNSLARFLYLVAAASMIQVFRDGLISVFVFTLIGAMPMMFVVCLHLLLPPVRRTVRRPAAMQARKTA
jgi:cellobiose-specific phosphotransferase system component IIC